MSRKYFEDAKLGIAEHSSPDDIEMYTLGEGRHHIWLRYNPTGQMVFKCSKIGVAPRNFLLELHGSGYIIPKWLELRAAGEFNGKAYHYENSPPEHARK